MELKPSVVPALKTHMFFFRKSVLNSGKRFLGFRGQYLAIPGISGCFLYVKRCALARVAARKDSIDKAAGKSGHLVERLFNAKLKL